MKILKLEIQGYRSIKAQSWQPGDLNILIGPNASGKSNLLRALEMLSASARGSLAKYVQQEGGMEPLVWDGKAGSVSLRAQMSPLPPYQDSSKDALTYELELARLGNSSAYQVEHELLGNFTKVENGEMTQPFKLLERDPRHAVVYSMSAQRFEAPPETVPEGESLLSAAAGPFTANRIVGDFQKELAEWTIYQCLQTHWEAPIRMPQITRPEPHVNSDGQNLIAVLHNLYTSSRNFKVEINTAMESAFGPDFEELLFPPAADQRIQLRVQWKSLNRARSAADLSDGTLRFLFLISVLANPSPPPLISIDEPETGLHPSMLPIVAEYARDAATRSQVILTTHSPEFLDAFEEPPTTTVVERINGETEFRVISGNELAYWLKQYTLGDLYRSKQLESMN